GRIPMADLLAPAIALAQDGFPVGPIAAREWAFFAAMIAKDPVCATIYRAGDPPAAGATFANPELAATLDAIAVDGPAAFYEGAPAKAAEQASAASGGVMTAADFVAHAGNFDTPLSTTFRGLTVL